MDVVDNVARQALAVLLVFALLGFTLWKLRRGGSPLSLPKFRRASSSRSLEQMERLALTPQHCLHLVRVQGRELLVATHPRGCSLLDADVEPAVQHGLEGAATHAS